MNIYPKKMAVAMTAILYQHVLLLGWYGPTEAVGKGSYCVGSLWASTIFQATE
jgi:hypothetical protein